MKCSICGINESVFLVRQISDYSTVEMHLCMECGKKRGLSAKDMTMEFSLYNLFNNLLQPKEKLPEKDKICPSCGQSLFELLKIKQTGCSECFTVFKTEIAQSLREQKRDGVYTGTFPKRLSHFRSILTDRMFFQSKLEQAVLNEDYEKAALYRDRLKVLETIALHEDTHSE